MLLRKKLNFIDFCGYVISQIIGAIAGAALLKWFISFGITDMTNSLGANGITGVGSVSGALITEILLTFIFIIVILGVTSDESKGNIAGIVIGLTLTFVHIVGIPLTGTSVNPARSIGPAIFAGSTAMSNLWVFIVGPLVGAVVAYFAYSYIKPIVKPTGKRTTRYIK
jgi:aquaporin Z